MLRFIFWFCLGSLLWAYALYPALMLVRARFTRAQDRRVDTHVPTVTVVLAVRNAENELERRVQDLLRQQYPADRMDIVVACNGCTDRTEQIAASIAAREPRVQWLTGPADEGKAGALNRGVARAEGDVVVFADVRQRFHPLAVRRLVRALRDESVGAVTGRLLIARGDAAVSTGVGGYWAIETQLRMAESRTGSIVGVTGAIYAIRRHLFTPLPPAVILDDMMVPLRIAEQGYHVKMAPRAIAYDTPSTDYDAEYRRRVRTLVGNYELMRLMPQLLSPTHPMFVRFVSHKLLRLLTPVLCIGLLLSGLLLPGVLYRFVAFGLLAVYVLGFVGLRVPSRALALPSAFLLLHSAGLTALARRRRGAADVWAR